MVHGGGLSACEQSSTSQILRDLPVSSARTKIAGAAPRPKGYSCAIRDRSYRTEWSWGGFELDTGSIYSNDSWYLRVPIWAVALPLSLALFACSHRIVLRTYRGVIGRHRRRNGLLQIAVTTYEVEGRPVRSVVLRPSFRAVLFEPVPTHSLDPVGDVNTRTVWFST